jgi:hypothetical protein
MRQLLLAVFALLGLGVASAQIFQSVAFTAPGSFVVGNATVPGGKYVIRLTDDSSMLELANDSDSISVLFEVETIDARTASKSTEIVFNKYGNKLVLKSIYVRGEESGALSSTEMAERHHMKAGKPTKVTIPATLVKE